MGATMQARRTLNMRRVDDKLIKKTRKIRTKEMNGKSADYVIVGRANIFVSEEMRGGCEGWSRSLSSDGAARPSPAQPPGGHDELNRRLAGKPRIAVPSCKRSVSRCRVGVGGRGGGVGP